MRWGWRATLAHLRPQGPVQSLPERCTWLAAGSPAHRGAAEGPLLLPLQVFGVTYDLDVVLVSRQPHFNMHEYARLRTPTGPVWLCKDARESDLTQTIVADWELLHDVLPEVPLERSRRRVVVHESVVAGELDLRIDYRNDRDQRCEVAVQAILPRFPVRTRNSSTMGHSRGSVWAVLDVSHKTLAKKASLSLDGDKVPLERIMGVVPFAVILEQTQAGMSAGSWRFEQDDGGYSSFHGDLRQAWTSTETELEEVVSQHGPLRTIEYRFMKGPQGQRRLAKVIVRAYGHRRPATIVHFRPFLPDLRMEDARGRGEAIVDVGGQPSHGMFRWTAHRKGDEAELRIEPVAPRWTLDRPMVYRHRRTEHGWESQGSVGDGA